VSRPDIDENVSMWAATARPRPESAPLRADESADVVIIGAGFTGLSTAHHLAARFPDRRIVVLEAGRIGNGASGRNGGMVLNWIHGAELSDPDRSRRIFGVTRAAIDDLEALVAAHPGRVRFRRDGCLEAVTDTRRAEEAHADAEKLASWGLPVTWLSGDALRQRLRSERVVGAVLDPTAGQLHGLDLLHLRHDLAAALGVTVYERTPVVAIREGKTIEVHTPGGVVRAAAMVLATNGYTPRLGYFRRGLFPLHSHVFATEPQSAETWARVGWSGAAGFSDDLDRIAYFSMTPDGRLLAGGGSNTSYGYRWNDATAWKGSAARGHEAVARTLHRYLPGAAELPVAQRWTGTLGITMSRTCTMGVRGAHRNVYFALGYSGHGVVLANLAGKVLADLYADHHEPWADLPFYQHRIGGIPGEPLRFVGYHAYTALTGRSPRKNHA
jgi:gamma-glutamylputrescine oxidase